MTIMLILKLDLGDESMELLVCGIKSVQLAIRQRPRTLQC